MLCYREAAKKKVIFLMAEPLRKIKLFLKKIKKILITH